MDRAEHFRAHAHAHAHHLLHRRLLVVARPYLSHHLLHHLERAAALTHLRHHLLRHTHAHRHRPTAASFFRRAFGFGVLLVVHLDLLPAHISGLSKTMP